MRKSTSGLRVASLATGMAVAAVASAAAGTYFDFSFSDLNSNSGINGGGKIYATDNGDGTYTAVVGHGMVYDSFAGTTSLTLLPGSGTSPSGAFIFDNQLLPQSDPVLLNGGLLFKTGSPTAGEVNIWGNSPGSYSVYEWTPGSSYNPATDNATFALNYAAVPEATTMILGLAATMPILSARRRRRA